MTIDPQNRVVRVLADAAAREATEPDAAAAAYRQAWELATDDYERCMAAHYLARVQASAEDRHCWNALALEKALAVADGRADGFLASLRLNLGRSLEDLGRMDEARAEYGGARDAARELPEGAYRSTIEEALDRAGRRVGQ